AFAYGVFGGRHSVRLRARDGRPVCLVYWVGAGRTGRGSGVAELPSGTVTFLFTDLEGSTRLWEEHPDAMRDALARHDQILHDAVTSHGGHVVKDLGDGVFVLCAAAHDGVAAAVDGQRALEAEPWGEVVRLRVRVGLHTAEAQHRDGDYYRPALHRTCSVMAAAHGGQIVVSHATKVLVAAALPEGLELADV